MTWKCDRRMIVRKVLTVAVILLFIGVSIPSTGTVVEKKFTMPTFYDGNILYVGGSGQGNYTNIQDAIDNASNGDTVFVYNGTYYENVIVHKSINLVGEDATTTIIDGGHIDDPLWINTSFVDVCGFTVTNSPIDGWSQGICVVDKKWHGPDGPYITLTDITISGCIVEGSNGGIRLDNTRNVEIAECIIRNNSCLSVYNIYSSHVRIHHCTIERNGNEADRRSGGIMVCKNPNLGASEYIEIFYCTIINNAFEGISIRGSSHVSIYHNEICGNSGKGISVRSSSVNIYGNHIFDNGMGVLWEGGIYLSNCINCVTIKENDIASNNPYGLYLMRSSGNSLIKNNFVNNRCNAFFSDFSFSNWNRNNWKKNYWDRPRLLLYPIFGKMILGKFIIPWVNFDWHPAREPYDIPMEV